MGKTAIRVLEKGDIGHLAENLREADRCELVALEGQGIDPFHVISRAVTMSSHVWAFVRVADNMPISLFGVAPMADHIGSPWMLGTEELYEHPRELVVFGRRYISLMTGAYPVLLNYVDARNEKSVRWLKRMGFQFADPEPLGPYGIPFHRFQMVTESCASPRVSALLQ
jgi:hypothetical protein